MNGSVSPLWVVQILAMQLAIFLALLLIVSAFHKAASPLRARRALHELSGISMHFAGGALRLVCLVEALAAGLLLLPATRLLGAALAGAVWGGYLFFMLRALQAGAEGVDCGCSFGTAHRPIGRYQILRNVVLLLVAAFVSLIAALSPAVAAVGGGAPVLASEGLGALALLALYAAFDHAMALQPARAGVAA